MTDFNHILLEKPPYQVLSFDAGGIYGLSTSIMLRKLCEKNESFLNGNDVTLFTGTSVGALISLYLAIFEHPRDAVLQNDNMEKAFANPLMYSNMLNPVQGFLSLCGLTAWSGEADFRKFLNNIFKDLTLGDLKQRVMITGFNYHGKIGSDGENSGWGTNIYTNFPIDNEQRNEKVADIAYNACSFPGMRPLPKGLSDGGIFSPDPSVAGIASVISRKKGEQENVDFIKHVVDNVLKKILQKLFQPIIKMLENSISSSETAVVIDDLMQATIDDILQFLANEIKPLDISFAADGKFTLEEVLFNLRNIKIELERLREETSLKGLSESVLKLTGLIIEKPQTTSSNSGLLRILGSLEISLAADLRLHLKDELDVMAETLKDVENAMEYYSHGEKNLIDNHEKEQNHEKHTLKFFASLVNNLYQFLIEITPSIKGTLEDITLLSLGTGQKDSYYWIKSINMGTSLFSLLPTNPLKGNWYPPQILTALQAPTCSANQGAEALLCKDKFCRLDPPAIQAPMPPVLPAVYYARNPFLRRRIINGIYSAMKSQVAKDGIAVADRWIKKQWCCK